MTPTKRLCDIVLALIAAAIVALPVGVIVIVLLIAQGRPLFHASERMRSPTRKFTLWKFRTMTVTADDTGVTGGDKTARVTRLGRFLRRTRLDEIPQLWNILTGDMSFVGPRPPLPVYVAEHPDLYALVLQSRPGLTGLATLRFRLHEERILAQCRTPDETDAVYVRRCIARKGRIDLIYQRRRSLRGDAFLLAATLTQIAWPRVVFQPFKAGVTLSGRLG